MSRLYTVLVWLLAPLALLRLLWRSRRNRAYLERWTERIGRWSCPPESAAVWIHAVSVGEVQAVQPLIRHLLSREQGLDVVVTTTTPTGARALSDLFGARVQHVYTPYDLPGVMRRFLGHVRPRVVLVMETEIWPNMLAECTRRGIPAILANARLSPRSARGYGWVGGFASQTFGRFAIIAAQSQADAQRFIALGAPRERVHVTGSIKFDVQLPASLRDRAEVMRRDWGSNRPVWVAASTHEGEDEAILDAHRRVREVFNDALLVLVPRHPERFERVATLVRRSGLTMARRSTSTWCGPEDAVYLGDSMGELPLFLAAADAAFIGGSLVPVGGHNLLEAAALAVPVAIGPYSFNFAEITRVLVAEQGAAQVADARALADLLTGWLGDAAERARIGENGLAFVARNRGALDRLVRLIEGYLPDADADGGSAPLPERR